MTPEPDSSASNALATASSGTTLEIRVSAGITPLGAAMQLARQRLRDAAES